MSSFAWLVEFLKNLEGLIPPPPRCHHAITYAQYGSDQTGWQDKLAVQVNDGAKFHCFFIEEADLAMSPLTVAQAISDVKHKRGGFPFQEGVATGQYQK